MPRSPPSPTGCGGRLLHGPVDIPTVGRVAVLMDPQGAAFAAHTAAGTAPGGHDGPWGVGEFSWHELATTDPDAAFGFYSDLFGWAKTEAMDMGPGGTYQMFGRTSDRSMGGGSALMTTRRAWAHVPAAYWTSV